jgi:hypothetical protein
MMDNKNGTKTRPMVESPHMGCPFLKLCLMKIMTKMLITRLKILTVLTCEPYTSLLHFLLNSARLGGAN